MGVVRTSFAFAVITFLSISGMETTEYDVGPTHEQLIAIYMYYHMYDDEILTPIKREIKEILKTITPLFMQQYALTYAQSMPCYPDNFLHKFAVDKLLTWILFPLITYLTPQAEAETPIEIMIRNNIPTTFFNIASGHQKLFSLTTGTSLSKNIAPTHYIKLAQAFDTYFMLRKFYALFKAQQ